MNPRQTLSLIAGDVEACLLAVRHAESVANATPHLVTGRSNASPLTLNGAAQARALGRTLRGHGVEPDAVYCSPARRTTETAHLILAELDRGIVAVVDDDLQELDQGAWVGRPRDDVYDESVLGAIARLGKDFRSPDGESMNDVARRMCAFLERAVPPTAAPIDRPPVVVCVSHSVAIRCLASTLDDWSQEETWLREVPNASVSRFTRRAGRWQLDELGVIVQ